jgi:CheY-like chemotaxis protein
VSEKCYHIIVADDDDDDQFIIKEAISEFHEKNIMVTSVYDGLQLLDYVQRKGSVAVNYQKPDLILLDINMPLLTGLEALQVLKSNMTLRDIPVCMISTTRTEEQQKKCIELGATGFYTKPNRIGAYRSILDELFSRTLYQAV